MSQSTEAVDVPNENNAESDNSVLVTNVEQTQAGSNSVKTGKDSVKTGTDSVKTGIDSVKTGTDSVKTGIDSVKTGTEVSSSVRRIKTLPKSEAVKHLEQYFPEKFENKSLHCF